MILSLKYNVGHIILDAPDVWNIMEYLPTFCFNLCMENEGKYTIHGAYECYHSFPLSLVASPEIPRWHLLHFETLQ